MFRRVNHERLHFLICDPGERLVLKERRPFAGMQILNRTVSHGECDEGIRFIPVIKAAGIYFIPVDPWHLNRCLRGLFSGHMGLAYHTFSPYKKTPDFFVWRLGSPGRSSPSFFTQLGHLAADEAMTGSEKLRNDQDIIVAEAA